MRPGDRTRSGGACGGSGSSASSPGRSKGNGRTRRQSRQVRPFVGRARCAGRCDFDHVLAEVEARGRLIAADRASSIVLSACNVAAFAAIELDDDPFQAAEMDVSAVCLRTRPGRTPYREIEPIQAIEKDKGERKPADGEACIIEQCCRQQNRPGLGLKGNALAGLL